MPKNEPRKWKPHNVEALGRNIVLVFKKGDIAALNQPTYEFIILEMGFIAHYNLSGFQSAYTDLDEFRAALQAGEMSEDPGHNKKWADHYEADPDFNKWYGPDYCKSVTEGIRRIIQAACATEKPPTLF